ncbi:adenosylcobalamin-dependent ribonucleoside-diphosphate reductase [Acidovorax sp. sic0104]|uniref:adenosylcobalamin-dependent ribonucleoside-diphosphate reductase n=1 Tax=Acidovorax sp. sic0104 TaxID=2854784 RepID=UPI001C489777|nr:adenosylcobalamin-dependent ribonucleoside-diphosphate reductase [Acidovorax sp. sic0104]MBV7542151.1 adenosylcobalamin-dependent ribonucleoside-diphosphate reductase [Acidovorax sp. sic0104]
MEMTAISQMGMELQPLSRELLLQKYAHGGEATPGEVLDRVARGLAKNEHVPQEWEPRFREALNYLVLGGRINASAGLEDLGTTWINCFVQPIADSVYEPIDGTPSIMGAVMEAAQTMRLGGGVGYDFSVIRPKGSWIKGTRSHASGPLSYMGIFNSMCETVISAGSRRGAQMAVLRCDHPDIEDFIVAKRVADPSIPWDKRPLRCFNMSVGITDELMKAVVDDRSFNLVHEAEPSPEQKAAGVVLGEDGTWVYKTVRAKDLFERIMRSNYDRGEPGVIFLDRVNTDNNLRYIESIAASNPCGEQMLPAYGCCDVGHVVLPRFVRCAAWEGPPSFDFEKLKAMVPLLVRMLDNVLDLTNWPLDAQREEAQNKRRIGVGYTGLGDLLIMMGLKYDSPEGREFAGRIAETVAHAAYEASVELSVERGPFPLFEANGYLEGVTEKSDGTFASRLPADLQRSIRRHGVRNSHLLSLAPVGTGSLTFANNCSSGCEPVFSFKQKREVIQPDGSRKLEEGLVNAAYLQYRSMGGDTTNLPDYFQTAQSLSAVAHLEMLMVLAPYVDSAISKTVNVPSDYPFEDFQGVYLDGWTAGLKGLTTFREGGELGAILISDDGKANAESHPKGLDAVSTAEVDPDRRLRLQKLPETVMNSLRWLDRPHLPDGNPSYTYMVENPLGDFAVMVGEHVNGTRHPFEVWINGAEAPRGLGAVAKTLSADMRTFDRGWLRLKLESLTKCDGQPVEIAMPPTGVLRTVPSVVSAFAQIVQYHAEKIGWLQAEGDSSLEDAMLFRKEPKAGPEGTLSWTVDVKNPGTGDDFLMIVKELVMPDGTRRPYSVWTAGEYPKVLDGLCKLLSIDMRVADPAWIGMKLRKLLNYREPQGDLWAPVPGEKRQACYPSTVAYMAQLLIHRFHSFGILDAEGHPVADGGFKEGESTSSVEGKPLQAAVRKGTLCPQCARYSVVKYGGCEQCSDGCGYMGSCG